MFRDALLVAKKDLRIELRSRVLLGQVLPFAVACLLLFALALGPDRDFLRRAAPGVLWITMLFAAVLAAQRSAGVEDDDGARDRLILSGLDPAGIFLGKALAVTLQLLALALVLTAGTIVLFGATPSSWWPLAVAEILASLGLGFTSVLYGSLAEGTKLRETLLPLLSLPTVAPILIAGTKVYAASLSGAGVPAAWLGLLAVFTLAYGAVGVLLSGALQET
ncbi:MAG: heme exporter protein CcmB [Actinomycetota bacterium]|jgi:heme exporter protein B